MVRMKISLPANIKCMLAPAGMIAMAAFLSIGLFVCGTSVGAEPEEEEAGAEADVHKLNPSYDPMHSTMNRAVFKTYREIFPPGYRIWQMRIREEDKAAEERHEIIVFQPESTGTHNQLVDGVMIKKLINYKLVVSGDGKVISEQIHPVPKDTVPKPVHEAFEVWRRPFSEKPKVEWIEWMAFQDEGSERLYVIQVIVNSVEGYWATLKADGTIVKQNTKFEDDE